MITEKAQIKDLLGVHKYVDVAAALGITPAAVSAWPDVLSQRHIDWAVGAAVRMKALEVVKQGESNGDSHEQGKARTERGETHCGDPEVADG